MNQGCDHAIEYLYHYLDDEISWVRRLRVRWHLRGCRACCDGFEFEQRVKAMVKAKVVDAPDPELFVRLRAFLREHGDGA